jgi:transcriptional regulator with XRE-family HTH domain
MRRADEDRQKFGERLRRLVAHMDFAYTIAERVPRSRAVMSAWDEVLARAVKRKRGDRTKLQGSRFLEDLAIHLVRQRARLLKADGVEAYKRTKQARKEVAAAFGIGPGTLEDWERGKRRRRRLSKGKGPD